MDMKTGHAPTRNAGPTGNAGPMGNAGYELSASAGSTVGAGVATSGAADTRAVSMGRGSAGRGPSIWTSRPRTWCAVMSKARRSDALPASTSIARGVMGVVSGKLDLGSGELLSQVFREDARAMVAIEEVLQIEEDGSRRIRGSARRCAGGACWRRST